MKSFLVIGIGRFGLYCIQKLSKMGYEVMAVDKEEERVQKAMKIATTVEIGDSTSPEFISGLGVSNFDAVIVSIAESFQSSLETAYLLKQYGAKRVISRASMDVQEKFLLNNGADEVVYPEKQVAEWTAVTCVSSRLLDFMALDDENGIFEVEVPLSWIGKTIKELDVRAKYKINVLGIKKDGKLNISITPDTSFSPDCTLMVLGKIEDTKKCFDFY